MDTKKAADPQEPASKLEEKTPVRPGKGVKRKYQSPNTGGKQDDADKGGVPRKRRKSSSLSRVGSPSTLLKPALTERQQMALLLQMTDPLKQGSLEETPTRTDSTHSTPRTRGSAHPTPRVRDSAHSTPRTRVQRRNERGETPLHTATIKGDLQAAVSLIDQGASVNATDHAGWTPLHEASNYGYTEVVALLLKHKAEVNVHGMDGDTPLHDAAINGHVETVKLLLKHGGNPTISNDKGITPMDACKDNEMLQLLKDGDLTGKCEVGESEASASVKTKPARFGGRIGTLKKLSQRKVKSTEEDEMPLPASSSSRPDADTSDMESDVFHPSKSKNELSGLSSITSAITPTTPSGRKAKAASRGMSYSDISSSESESELMEVVATKRNLKLHSSLDDVSEGKESEEEEGRGGGGNWEEPGSASDVIAKEVFSEGEQSKGDGISVQHSSPPIKDSSIQLEATAKTKRPSQDQSEGRKEEEVSSKQRQHDDSENESESDIDIDASPPVQKPLKPLQQGRAASGKHLLISHTPGSRSSSMAGSPEAQVASDDGGSVLLVSVPLSLVKVPEEGKRKQSCASEGEEGKDSKVKGQASIDVEAEKTEEGVKERFVVPGPDLSDVWTHKMKAVVERRDSTSSQDSRSSDKQHTKHSRKPQHVFSSKKVFKESTIIKKDEVKSHVDSGSEEIIEAVSSTEKDNTITFSVSVDWGALSSKSGTGKVSTSAKDSKSSKDKELSPSGSANAQNHGRGELSGTSKSRIKELQCEEDIDGSDSKSTIVSLPTSLPIVFSGYLPASQPQSTTQQSTPCTTSEKQPSAGYSATKDTLMTPPSFKPKALPILECLKLNTPQRRSSIQQSSVAPSKDTVTDQESSDESSLPPKKRFRAVQRSMVIQQRQKKLSSPVSVPSNFPSFLMCTQDYRSNKKLLPTNPKVSGIVKIRLPRGNVMFVKTVSIPVEIKTSWVALPSIDIVILVEGVLACIP